MNTTQNKEPYFWIQESMDFLHGLLVIHAYFWNIWKRTYKNIGENDLTNDPVAMRHSKIVNCYNLLMAYSIETLLKACLAIAEPDSKKLTTHELSEIARII